MKKTIINRAVAGLPTMAVALAGAMAATASLPALAADADGQLKIGGALRARYDHSFDNAQNVSKLSFDTFRIDLN